MIRKLFFLKKAKTVLAEKLALFNTFYLHLLARTTFIVLELNEILLVEYTLNHFLCTMYSTFSSVNQHAIYKSWGKQEIQSWINGSSVNACKEEEKIVEYLVIGIYKCLYRSSNVKWCDGAYNHCKKILIFFFLHIINIIISIIIIIHGNVCVCIIQSQFFSYY